MKRILLCIALIISAGTVASCGGSDDPDASLEVFNASSYDIYEVYISEIDAITWGIDLLGLEILLPGDSLIVSELACDIYDVRLVDFDGDTCDLYDVPLCADDTRWTVTNGDLSSCPLFD